MSMTVWFGVKYIGTDKEYEELEASVKAANMPPKQDKNGYWQLGSSPADSIFDTKNLHPIQAWMERQQLWEDEEMDQCVIVPRPVMDDFLLITGNILKKVQAGIHYCGRCELFDKFYTYKDLDAIADALFDNPEHDKQHIASCLEEACAEIMPSYASPEWDWDLFCKLHKCVAAIIKATGSCPPGKYPIFTYSFSK